MKPSRSARSLSTILVTDIVASTGALLEKGDKAWMQVMESHNQVCRNAFARFHGRELHITGDGFVAAFATPTEALQCAVTISQAIKALGIEVRIGLHTGEVELQKDLVGGISLHLVARVADQAQGSEIVVTATLKDLVAGSGVEFIGKGERALKGIQGTWNLFAVVQDSVLPAERSPDATDPPKLRDATQQDALPASRRPFPDGKVDTPIQVEAFVDREPEMQRLFAALEKARQGAGQFMLVSGEAGRGKTALINEFSRQALKAVDDLIITYGYGNAYSGIGDPYLPFKDVFSILCGGSAGRWDAGELADEHTSRMRRLLPFTLESMNLVGPDLVDVLVPNELLLRSARWAVPHLVDTFAWQATPFSSIEGENFEKKQDHLFQQCASVLTSIAARNPLLVILEDLHWVDSATISLLFHLSRHIPDHSMMVVGTYRTMEVELSEAGKPHPLGSVLHELKRQFGDLSIDLNSVPDEQERRFLDMYVDQEHNLLGEGFRQDLFQRTQGHALFTVELMRDLRERGALVKDFKGNWVLEQELIWEELPARLEGVLGDRIMRLDEGAREIVEVAAVEGQKFTAEVIAGVLEKDEREIIRTISHDLGHRYRLIQELGEQQISDQHVSRFQFVHHLFQQFLYNRLSFSERRVLHAEVANHLERLHAGNLDDIAVSLSNHFAEAGEHYKNLEYRHIAGERALRQFAFQEAVGHLTAALQLLEREAAQDKFSTARLYSSLGTAYLGLGELGRARENMELALKILDRPIPPSRIGLGYRVVRQAGRQIFHRLFPARLLTKTVSDERRRFLVEATRLYALLGTIYYFANDDLLSVYCTLRHLNVVELTGVETDLAEAFSRMSVIMGFIPLRPLADRYQERAMQLAAKVGQPANIVRVSILTSVYKSGAGEWELALQRLQHAQTLARQIGDDRGWGESSALVAYNTLLGGDYARSFAIADALLDNARQRSNAHHQVFGLEVSAMSLLRWGETAEAVDRLEEANDKLGEIEDISTEIEVTGLLASAYLQQERYEPARKTAERTLAQIAESKPLIYTAIAGYAGATEVYLDLLEQAMQRSPAGEKLEPLQDLCLQATKACFAFSRTYAIARPTAWLYQGRYADLMGRPQRARRAWQKSLVSAKKLNLRYEQARALHELGRHLPDSDPARPGYLHEAQELLDGLDERPKAPIDRRDNR